uniref:Zinc knuckle CX2CX4HX4C n=1 Tax=Tanacetum cinerariifolium TaxID=118510 RepID=A0A699H230_TANCI|nr:zinc knuckle CX2CX4HX4C [Tanacetum cinerariifolium]
MPNFEGVTKYVPIWSWVEIKTKKELKDVIQIEYIGKNEHVEGTKEVAVMYDWKLKCCSYCNVFGHCLGKCNKKKRKKGWRLKEHEDEGKNVEDVYENEEGIAQTMTVDNVSGLSKEILH